MSAAPEILEQIPGVSPEIYSGADFALVSRLVYETAGIVLPAGKSMLVYSRLAPMVRASGCVTFAKYLERVRSDRQELASMVAALTTNHTFFYREAHHFEHLRDTVRPMLMNVLMKDIRPVRLWSAGCSSGEETWSIAMTLLGPDRRLGEQLAVADLRILASDLAPHAIQRAEAGRYLEADLKPVPEPLRRVWTDLADGEVTMSDIMRSLVRFRLLNLLGDWPIRGQFDVIFCRNVMIYFDNPTKEFLVERFAHALAPGGYLYIGHSERVTGPAATMVELVGPTIYRKAEA